MQQLGVLGENAAAQWYEARGMTIEARNVHTPFGELDLIVRGPGSALRVVEVKTRSSEAFGAAEAVTCLKWRKMRRAAAYWLRAQRSHYSEVSFDVVSIVAGRITVHEGVDHGAC